MTQRTPSYLNRRFSNYVPAMGYDARVIHGAPYDVQFGPVAIAATANLLSLQSMTTAGTTTTILQGGNTDPVITAVAAEFPYGPGFGRCLQVVGSGATTGTVTIKGRDYLRQPMTESFTLNGTNAVIGVKAFKWVDSITWTATSGVNLSVGTTDKLGLPFCTANILTEEVDGARVATLGTFVAPIYTDPQTATTADPRGTYDPTTTLDGTKRIAASIVVQNRQNASGNGGLHGIAHYYA